jgi:hypothetical protein
MTDVLSVHEQSYNKNWQRLNAYLQKQFEIKNPLL